MSRFSEPQDPLFRALNTSVGFDYRLAPFDIEQSLAHARMLARQDIISADDLVELERGLGQVRGEIESNTFEIRPVDEESLQRQADYLAARRGIRTIFTLDRKEDTAYRVPGDRHLRIVPERG